MTWFFFLFQRLMRRWILRSRRQQRKEFKRTQKHLSHLIWVNCRARKFLKDNPLHFSCSFRLAHKEDQGLAQAERETEVRFRDSGEHWHRERDVEEEDGWNQTELWGDNIVTFFLNIYLYLLLECQTFPFAHTNKTVEEDWTDRCLCISQCTDASINSWRQEDLKNG